MERDTRFKPGVSGNPSGRPKGVGKVAKLRALLEPRAEELVEKAMSMALEGDTTALRLCLERLVPPIKIKDEPVRVQGLDGSQSLVEQGQAIISAVAKGAVTPSEAATLLRSLAAQSRIIEIEDLERRVAALEGHGGR
ncbi:MAG: DUF5681 domain-containing protein [Gammaproteobacteria bacterium]|jgi:hypothetical protein